MKFAKSKKYIKKVEESNVYDVAIKTPLSSTSYLSKESKNNVFLKREDLQPSYAQTLAGESDQGAHGWYGSMINTLGSCIGTMGAIPCCIFCPNPYKPVSQGNVGLVTKFGRFYRAVDPGLVKINPLSERLIQVDVKIQIVGQDSNSWVRK